MPDQPAVHVVFTRETFPLLRLGVYTLQASSALRFRIVCNGLPENEVEDVARFCERFDRVDYLDFPTAGRMLPHGTLLQSLLERESGEWFAFVDSDVFALAPFQDELDAVLTDADVVSLADHPVQEGKAQHVGTGGGSSVSPSGLQLAHTFFAFYRRQAVLDLIRDSGVSLERYQRQSQIPAAIQAEIPPADLGKGTFDTGKLMCVLASLRGLRVRHQPLAPIFHMGRMSVPSLAATETMPARLRSKRQLRAFFGEFMLGLHEGKTVAVPALADEAVHQLLLDVCPRLTDLHTQMLNEMGSTS